MTQVALSLALVIIFVQRHDVILTISRTRKVDDLSGGNIIFDGIVHYESNENRSHFDLRLSAARRNDDRIRPARFNFRSLYSEKREKESDSCTSFALTTC